MTGYGEDLSFIHDGAFSGLAQAAGEWIVQELGAAGIERGTVVELGCGGGVTAAVLVAAGHSVVGIDCSPHMIELARRRVPAAELRTGSFVTEPLPECDAVVAVGEVLNYLFDEGNTADALDGLFGRVSAALRPGGLLVFDLDGPGRYPGGRARGWAAGDGWAVLYDAAEDPDTLTLTRAITAFRQVDASGAYRRTEERHRLRLERPDDVLRRLEAAGLRARTSPGYGDAVLAAGNTVFLARRPA